MKKYGWIVAALAVVFIAGACIWFICGYEKPEKTVSFKGYEILVPEDWVASSDGTLTDKEGQIAGKFVFIDEEPDIENAVSYADTAPVGNVNVTQMDTGVVKSVFDGEQGKAAHYLIYGLPNPEPYAASLTIYLSRADAKTADAVAASFQHPTMGTKPPAKNVLAPAFEEIGADKTAKLKMADGSVQVKNISLIENFIKLQQEGYATGLDMICYQEEDGAQTIESWNHIENSDGHGYMYTYYDRGDGVFTYDNNPVIFQSITKEVLEDKGITAYRLKVGEAETARLLEIPVNLYRDNAQELLALKTAESTDETVMQILDKIMPEELRAGVTVKKTGKSVTLIYDKNSKINPETISKDVAVIFALSSDIDSVTAMDENGKTYVLERDKVMHDVQDSSENATDSPENFAKFAEDLENVDKAVPNNPTAAEDGVASGTVIYSGTVVISPSAMVTHPRTGERVAVGPYAEKYGYGSYLGKPITATVTKKGDKYIATATCGGAVLASRSYNSLQEAQSAIALIKAYS